MRKCKQCGRYTKNKIFCSKKCKGKSQIRRWEHTCERCGKVFHHNNKYYTKKGLLRFCSYECKNKKYYIDENYFDDDLTKEKLETLGQIICTAHIKRKNEIIFFGDLETLSDIKRKFKSTYPIKNSDKGLHRMKFTSTKLSFDLIDLGLKEDKLFKDVPRDDLWEGMKKTNCYKEEKGICLFTTESRKIAKWVEDTFNGETSSRTFKDTHRNGIIAMLYIVSWKKEME